MQFMFECTLMGFINIISQAKLVSLGEKERVKLKNDKCTWTNLVVFLLLVKQN